MVSPPVPSLGQDVRESDARIRASVASTRPNASGRSTRFASRLEELTEERVADFWRLDNTYVRGHRRNCQVLEVFVVYIIWFVESQKGLTPLAYQTQQLQEGKWSKALIDYDGFEYVEGSLFPADFKLPEFSLAPYLTVRRVCWGWWCLSLWMIER